MYHVPEPRPIVHLVLMIQSIIAEQIYYRTHATNTLNASNPHLPIESIFIARLARYIVGI